MRTVLASLLLSFMEIILFCCIVPTMHFIGVAITFWLLFISNAAILLVLLTLWQKES